MSIAQHGYSRKENARRGGLENIGTSLQASREPSQERGKPLRPGRRPGASPFTPWELEELARADAELDDKEVFLTPEERAASAALDRAATTAAGPAEKKRSHKRTTQESPQEREIRLAARRVWRAAHREQLRLASATYNASHRQERRDYQKAYDATHREQISAKRRERYAAKKAAQKAAKEERKENRIHDGRKI